MYVFVVRNLSEVYMGVGALPHVRRYAPCMGLRTAGTSPTCLLPRHPHMQHADTPQVVGTCHGMSPKAMIMRGVASTDMPWYVPTAMCTHTSAMGAHTSAVRAHTTALPAEGFLAGHPEALGLEYLLEDVAGHAVAAVGRADVSGCGAYLGGCVGRCY